MKVYDKQFINGEWRVGTGKSKLSNYNPFSGELLYEYQSASAQDVDDACQAAAKAQKDWAKTPPSLKQAMLEKLISVILEMKEDIYACLIEEGGSPLPKANFEFYTSIDIVKEAMSFPAHMEGKIFPSNIQGKENYIFRVPKGVIGVITPWNVPIVLAMRSVVPAVATGNGVVLKPASDTPGSGFLIAEIFERAGFPKGLVNVVAGRGSEIGDAIVEHPIPALISFTGSTEVGRRIGSVAGSMIKDVSLELGGNNAMIILKDADLVQAAKAAAFGAFFHQGQVCMALNRIIIDASVHDEFVDIFVQEVKHLPIGDPGTEGVFMGPIINRGQQEKIEKLVADTIAVGAKVALEGRTEGGLIYPWILTEVANDMPAAANEVFGPVCCIIKVKDEAEAIQLTNETQYGLSGSVFTKDVFHGIKVARQIDSGMVHVNDQSINDEPHVMFGGSKFSGVGRFNGKWVADKFTTEKWISVQAKDRAF
ncbi:MAG: aldehyde dehydrogenase [Firmicutes bacterium]|nr:aldehyde dehydrogenase [Bacillota bacterium]